MAGQQWPVPESLRTPSRVVVVGVGGSAIGADVIAAVMAQRSSVPVQVVRGYEPPQVDDDALIVVSSFSGQTEEAVSAFKAAARGSAMSLAMTTGGKLASLAESAGLPLFRYEQEGPPRTAFGYGLFPLMAILERLGAMEIDERELSEAFAILDRGASQWGVESPQDSNLAKQTAGWIGERVPMVVGADFLAVAARRWAAQANENASRWAFHAALPEADHNLIEAYASSGGVSDSLCVLLLSSRAAHPRTGLRVHLMSEALSAAGVDRRELASPAEGVLGSLLWTSYLGDWVSLYMAMLGDVDPAQVPAIEGLKREMARR